jgi:hypothetical protein
MKKKTFLLFALALTAGRATAQETWEPLPAEAQADICIYGATSAGITAAVEARRQGHSVLLIEPGPRIGGLTAGGLGMTDIGKVEIIQPAGPAIGNTYRPAYIPPKPSVPPTTVKPKATVDTSKIHAGTVVTHKAFGPGQVKGIDGGLLVVTFNGTDKKFQFPGAFEQGFLKLI